MPLAVVLVRKRWRWYSRSGHTNAARGAGQVLATTMPDECATEVEMDEGHLGPEIRSRLDAAILDIQRLAPSMGHAHAEVEVLSKMLPYQLDDVQKEAFLRHAEGKDVVCSMPTGSGKTAIGILAIWRALTLGKRVLYSTPLKALSAQKWREFADVFGPGAVGLVTGDFRTLPSAPVVVATAESLRNQCYPGSGGSASAMLDSVGAIVLDELHWINDPDRGTTWEELVLHCPNHASLLGLSATVGGDPSIFCDWVASVRGGRGCALVTSHTRAVPLHFYALCPMRDSEDDARPRLRQLLDVPLHGGTETQHEAAASPAEVDAAPDSTGEATAEAQHAPILPVPSTAVATGAAGSSGGRQLIGRWPALPPQRRARSQRRPGTAHVMRRFPMAKRLGIRPVQMERMQDLSKLIRRLQRLKWLPALNFVMSRRGCDQSVDDVALLACVFVGRHRLLTDDEKSEVAACLATFEAAHPEVRWQGRAVGAMMEGAAAHHAGQLPAQRAFVEQLFERGLLKLVFATETLAAGINMPAKCVVLNSHRKATNRGNRNVNGSELLQMSGRAGRRGIDVVGHAILNFQPSSAATARWASKLVAAGPDPLRSNFAPSYSMLCALLPGKRLADLDDLASRSFGAFLAARQPEQEALGTEDQEEDADLEWDESLSPEGGDMKQVLEAEQLDAIKELEDFRLLVEESGVSEVSMEEYADLREKEEFTSMLRTSLGGFDDDGLESLFGALGEPPSLEEDDAAAKPPEPQQPRWSQAITEHEVHDLPHRDDLVSAIRQRRATRNSCERRAKRLESMVLNSERYRREAFGRYAAIMQEAGLLEVQDDGVVQTTLAGMAASRITSGANSLWLGKALLPKPLGADVITRFDLGPAEVAALVAAVVTDDSAAAQAKGDNERSPRSLVTLAPEGLQSTVSWAMQDRWRLAELQWRHGVYESVPFGFDAMVLAHSWAAGESWEAVVEDASQRGMADGDLFRCLRRTLEVLQGLASAVSGPGFEDLSGLGAWRRRVSRAQAAIDRSPLSSNVLLEGGELELEL